MHKVLELLETLDSNAFAESVGFIPDPWQADVIASESLQILLLASRQSGKTSTMALKVAKHILQEPDRLCLIVSPSLRQSNEVMLKIEQFLAKKDVEYKRDNALEKVLQNGSRVIALPGTEKTIRTYSAVSMLILDEASRIPDEVYHAVRPMLAVSQGQLIMASTPFGKRGFFYEVWDNREGWDWYKATADDCPRITEEFLERERQSLPEWFFRQEYYCEFVDPIGTVFAHQDILDAFTDEVDDDPLVNEISESDLLVEMEDVKFV